jgi:hypothetical protein
MQNQRYYASLTPLFRIINLYEITVRKFQGISKVGYGVVLLLRNTMDGYAPTYHNSVYIVNKY